MGTVRRTLSADGRLAQRSQGREETVVPRVDLERVERMSEAEIAAQMAADDEAARQDAAAYARRVRRRHAAAGDPGPGHEPQGAEDP